MLMLSLSYFWVRWIRLSGLQASWCFLPAKLAGEITERKRTGRQVLFCKISRQTKRVPSRKILLHLRVYPATRTKHNCSCSKRWKPHIAFKCILVKIMVNMLALVVYGLMTDSCHRTLLRMRFARPPWTARLWAQTGVFDWHQNGDFLRPP